MKNYKEKILTDIKHANSDIKKFFDEQTDEQSDEFLVNDELYCSEDDILPYNIDCQRIIR